MTTSHRMLRNLIIVLVLIATALLVDTSGGRTGTALAAPPPTPTAPATGSLAPGQDPDAAVAAGRLDQSVLTAVRDSGAADVLLVLDDAPVRARVEQGKAARGVTVDDAQALTEREQAYRALKQQALAGTANGASVLRDYEHFGVQHIRLHNEAALRALLARPEVSAVRANGVNQTTLTESLPLINQPQAFTAGFTGAGTSVAVLDTGVDYTRPAFGSCTAPNTPSTTCKVAFAKDFAPDDGQLDANGHGTNVAGIVLGVAPSAKVLALDVFNGNGASDADILAALNWVVANKATYKITAVNMSLGMADYHTTQCTGTSFDSPFANLRAAGVLPVVAAGNSAQLSVMFTNGISFPACVPGAVSVGAVYDSNVGMIAYSSCTDWTTAANQITCFSQSASYLSVLAPGALITAAGITAAGTSQATPHVAGAVAALRSKCTSATPTQLETALTSAGPSITDARNGVTKHRLDVAAAGSALGCGGTGTATIPAAPSNLRLGTVTTTSIQILWNDNSTNETSFQISYHPTGAVTSTQVTLAANTTTWTHSGLTVGAAYDYQVRACNGAGCSAWSNSLHGEISAKPPVAPSNLGQGTVTDTSIELVWTDNSTNESSFQVAYASWFASAWTFVSAPANTTRFAVTNLTPWSGYTFYVRACNTAGCSEWSNYLLAITSGPFAAATGVSATAEGAPQPPATAPAPPSDAPAPGPRH